MVFIFFINYDVHDYLDLEHTNISFNRSFKSNLNNLLLSDVVSSFPIVMLHSEINCAASSFVVSFKIKLDRFLVDEGLC